ncbi:hypothetical protein Hamer_G019738 [Homarus americanus]|uniref:Metallothionein n=1 Tax=Homarus americanus TaxID=6706 RepID=A0A8J5K9U2_HOMAM|nr:hypothetical protein Hamer_G019738 [Homarus americanus]
MKSAGTQYGDLGSSRRIDGSIQSSDPVPVRTSLEANTEGAAPRLQLFCFPAVNTTLLTTMPDPCCEGKCKCGNSECCKDGKCCSEHQGGCKCAGESDAKKEHCAANCKCRGEDGNCQCEGQCSC